MGRGVTQAAALCLGHLAREMGQEMTQEPGQQTGQQTSVDGASDWPMRWLHSTQQSQTSRVQPGLAWLFPLWAYRDPAVRTCSILPCQRLFKTRISVLHKSIKTIQDTIKCYYPTLEGFVC